MCQDIGDSSLRGSPDGRRAIPGRGTHLREGRSVAELARTHGVHRSWLYKLLARYRADGDAGLAPRSRRPRSSPSAMPIALADEIVALRGRLLAEGLDAGALTIQWHLAQRSGGAPSASSIIRVLRRRGLVTPEPRKRPRSSFVRFQAALSNELWQTDATHWALADGSAVEILNVIDDHSRLLVAAAAFRTVRAADVVGVFHDAALRYGYPAALLSDNAAVFSGGSRQGKVLLESELERLGIRPSHARPYHPQTCGKVERFHQTQKRWLAKQPSAATLEELSAQLDRQRIHYNLHRPHRAIGRRTTEGVEPSCLTTHAPEACSCTNSDTSAREQIIGPWPTFRRPGELLPTIAIDASHGRCRHRWWRDHRRLHRVPPHKERCARHSRPRTRPARLRFDGQERGRYPSAVLERDQCQALATLASAH